jgi:chromosome segregation ATPase
MDALKERDSRLTTENAEAKDDLASRTRQLQRAQDDINKMKAETDAAKRQLLELSKVKDDGFKKLNEQLAEVEHLREVIREQERMLEERRVGLISIEEALQDLRKDREARIKELASMKGERDELRIGFNRLQAQMQSTDEENRRLARLMQDIGDGGEAMRLSRQLKDAQFEAETQTLERRRLAQALEAAENRIEKLQQDVTKLESSAEADEGRAKQAIADMHNTEEARVKAESARTKAEQERAAALKDKEDLEREVEKLRQRLGESGPVTIVSAGGGKADPAAAQRVGELEDKVAEAQHRAEEAQKRLQDIMERATKLEDENTELGRKLREATKKTAVAGPTAGPHELRNKALEVYHSVNDVLAELRVNISVVRDEFDAFAGKNADARARTIRDAIEAASGQTEDVKGVLRNLRELAET